MGKEPSVRTLPIGAFWTAEETIDTGTFGDTVQRKFDPDAAWPRWQRLLVEGSVCVRSNEAFYWQYTYSTYLQIGEGVFLARMDQEQRCFAAVEEDRGVIIFQNMANQYSSNSGYFYVGRTEQECRSKTHRLEQLNAPNKMRPRRFPTVHFFGEEVFLGFDQEQDEDKFIVLRLSVIEDPVPDDYGISPQEALPLDLPEPPWRTVQTPEEAERVLAMRNGSRLIAQGQLESWMFEKTRLLESPDPYTLVLLAKNPSLPESMYTFFATRYPRAFKKNDIFRILLAGDPNLSFIPNNELGQKAMRIFLEDR